MLKMQKIKIGNTRIVSRVIKYAILLGGVSILAACHATLNQWLGPVM